MLDCLARIVSSSTEPLSPRLFFLGICFFKEILFHSEHELFFFILGEGGPESSQRKKHVAATDGAVNALIGGDMITDTYRT